MELSRLGPWAVAFTLLGAAAPATARDHAPKPPVAATHPHHVVAPAGTRSDPYYWLRDDTRKNPQMLGYLAAENAYADAVLAPTKSLQERLYSEITGRIKQDGASVPYRLRGYWYYTRFDTGQDYPVMARRKGAMTAPEQVMLDQPAMAKGKGYFAVNDAVVSQDNRLLAYAEDTVGRRQYVLHVKDLATGQDLPDVVENVEPNMVWADDNRTVQVRAVPQVPRPGGVLCLYADLARYQSVEVGHA